MTARADIIICAQLWSMLVGLPLCAVGGVLYSWTSSEKGGIVAGIRS